MFFLSLSLSSVHCFLLLHFTSVSFPHFIVHISLHSALYQVVHHLLLCGRRSDSSGMEGRIATYSSAVHLSNYTYQSMGGEPRLFLYSFSLLPYLPNRGSRLPSHIWCIHSQCPASWPTHVCHFRQHTRRTRKWVDPECIYTGHYICYVAHIQFLSSASRCSGQPACACSNCQHTCEPEWQISQFVKTFNFPCFIYLFTSFISFICSFIKLFIYISILFDFIAFHFHFIYLFIQLFTYLLIYFSFGLLLFPSSFYFTVTYELSIRPVFHFCFPVWTSVPLLTIPNPFFWCRPPTRMHEYYSPAHTRCLRSERPNILQFFLPPIFPFVYLFIHSSTH